MPSIAIIGAGATGLAAARVLVNHGFSVRVFDKGRRVGGRMASRETSSGTFDHGAQQIRVAGTDTSTLVNDDVAAIWPCAGEQEGKTVWLGVPTMNRLAQHWASGLDVQCSVAVITITPTHPGWLVHLDQDRPPERFDAALVTVPTPQALRMIPDAVDVSALNAVRYDPCWAVMWTPHSTLPETIEYSAGSTDDPVAWLAREDLKPGRAGPPRLILHASASWSVAHLELAPEEAAPLLIEEASKRLGMSSINGFRLAHRWRYAFVCRPLGVPFLQLAPGLVYASDAGLGSRIELAMASGRAAGEALVATFPCGTETSLKP